MKQQALVFIIAALLAGCSTVPFQRPACMPLSSEQQENIVERFQATLPQSFQLLNSIVFEYNWRAFTGIGYLDVDRHNRVFKVVCLNPMGVKLFELSGDRNSVTSHYTIEAFSQYGDVTTAVGNDIRRIYFDLIPSPDARVWKRRYSVSFRQAYEAGTLEYVFTGTAGDLIEKNFYDEGGLAWRVSYYAYREQNGKRYPQGIALLHYNHGYRLTIRQKELRS
jgi:outer membrane biogenesis lipoprotein LolB